MKRPRRSTPPGQHKPVMLDEVLRTLEPQPGQVVVDCTLGWGGHAAELLKRVGPTGLLIGLDLDADNLPRARPRLEEVGAPFHLHHANFAGLEAVLGEHGIDGADALVADLGMSSMQVDDPERGFSYRRDGLLDMRMDRSRGRTAAELLATLTAADLANLLIELGDEPAPRARGIAKAIVAAHATTPIVRTGQLAQIIQEAVGEENWQLHPKAGKWQTHPAARAFQALRIFVNREPGNLANLLRILPGIVKPGGKAAIITFHSGEDRAVKDAFKLGRHAGVYDQIAEDALRPSFHERQTNPRSRSAKLRWARKPGEPEATLGDPEATQGEPGASATEGIGEHNQP